MKLNRFSAMPVILNSQVLKRDDSNTWSIRINDGHFGTISKSNGKYFAHYHNRTTSLKGHKHFMQAIADMLDSFISFVNHIHSTVMNEPFYDSDGWTAVVCHDRKVRVKHVSYPFYRVVPQHDGMVMAMEIHRCYPSLVDSFSTALAIANTFDVLYLHERYQSISQ